MKLDKNFLVLVGPGVNAVWQEIASDLQSNCDECGQRLTNAMAVESILDADRLTTFGYPEADKAVDEATKEHGYDKVRKYIGKHFPLV